MTKYTDAMIAELRDNGPINNDFALDFAARYDISVQSVRQKASRDETIGYQAKPKRVTKTGEAVESKAEIVESIADMLERDVTLFESLENANKQVLVDIRGALQDALAAQGADSE